MSKLTDTQLVILSSALRRNDRGVEPAGKRYRRTGSSLRSDAIRCRASGVLSPERFRRYDLRAAGRRK